MESPAWSPDGQAIAFTSARSGTPAIWTWEPNGRLNQVTPDLGVHLSWSPASKRIVYVGLNQNRNSTIYVIGADGTGNRDVTHSTVPEEYPVWSPNGKWIAFRSLNADWKTHEVDSLVIVNPSGGSRRTLARGGAIFPGAFSPASDAVLFMRIANPRLGTPGKLFIVSLKGGPAKPVARTTNAIGGASWHS